MILVKKLDKLNKCSKNNILVWAYQQGKGLRLHFLQNISDGCFCKMMKFYKDISQRFFSQIDVIWVVKNKIVFFDLLKCTSVDIFKVMC